MRRRGLQGAVSVKVVVLRRFFAYPALSPIAMKLAFVAFGGLFLARDPDHGVTGCASRKRSAQAIELRLRRGRGQPELDARLA